MLRTLSLLSLACIVISLAGCDIAKQKQLAAEIEMLKAQNDQLQVENKKLQEELDKTNAELQKQQAEVTRITKMIEEGATAAESVVKGLTEKYGDALKGAVEGLPEAGALKEGLLRLREKGTGDDSIPPQE